MGAKMEKKLKELIDRQEIHDVLMRYARGLDRFDYELVRSCYFDDAIDDHDNHVAYVNDFIPWANETSGYFKSCQHGMLNHSVEFDGDNAYCETYWIFTGIAETPPHGMSMGRYIDHFQKRKGEWRIANRVNIIEGSVELPDSVLAANFPKSKWALENKQPATRDRTDISYHRPPVPRKPD